MTTTNGRVLVVGGHGAVGSAAAAALDRWFPGRVLTAGRSRGVRVDVTDTDRFRRVLTDLGDVRAVVLCVQPPDAGPARACLERGTCLVDVNADPALLADVSRLDDLAATTGTPAVLSAGVAPGLTNLLARRAHDAVGGAERLELTVLLGAGERHGADAVRWTVDALAAPHGTACPRRLPLPGHGRRKAHPFPFPDQYTLPGTLGVPEVTTRLCLDSRAATGLLFALRPAVRRPALRRAATSVLRRTHVGGDAFAVRADARRGSRHAAYALTGRGQSRISGLVAAHATRLALAGSLPAGVRHIEELPQLADLPERLAVHGVTLHAFRGGEE
ncbi:saccharopine dehydrogenase [Streptomyces sp. JJ36]|uniref:saccharopine dehydrogenase n=1 Tax=Streptomyces sp. JJ36 TaxID=2736645 RepID=UPI001F4509FD|nr:saccharopine dehydrogenase [Streptomyces sp. JJ36]MCF6524796.1 saccharopine dehydrogenase [Streptomyces sp. JJ36]